MGSDLSGALVDCTILIVAYLAAQAGLIPQMAFTGVLFSIVGARATMIKRGGGGGPKGGSGIVAGSAALCLAFGLSAALFHSFGRQSSTV